MTVIVVRDGVMAADSRSTSDTEAGGTRMSVCEKLYQLENCVIGVAGDGFAAIRFVDWFNSMQKLEKGGKGKKRKRDDTITLADGDFSALVLYKDGTLVEYDRWLIGETVHKGNPFYAIGSGAKAALGALHVGADAVEAVAAAILVCPFCGGPVTSVHITDLESDARPVKETW